VAAEEQDLRQRLSSALDGLSDEFIAEVTGGIFSMERVTTADCPHCGKAAKVRVPDYRGITAALATLADQGKGKAATAAPPAPKEASQEELMEAIRLVQAEMTDGELARLAG
jgi:hypothetical protein